MMGCREDVTVGEGTGKARHLTCCPYLHVCKRSEPMCMLHSCSTAHHGSQVSACHFSGLLTWKRPRVPEAMPDRNCQGPRCRALSTRPGGRASERTQAAA